MEGKNFTKEYKMWKDFTQRKRFFTVLKDFFAGNKKFHKRKCSLLRKEKYSLFNYAKLVDENRSNMKIKWKKRIYGLIMAADDVFFSAGHNKPTNLR